MNANPLLPTIPLLLCLTIAPAFAAPTTAPAGWHADLAMLKDELPKRHVNAFTKSSRADFEAAIDALDERINQLADDDIQVGMMQIVASLGDAHTMIGFGKKLPMFSSYPIGIYIFKDGPFLAVAGADHRELLQAKVL